MSTLTPGDLHTAEIATVTKAGNAAVKVGSDFVTIGPIDQDILGKGSKVTFRFYGGSWGVLLDENKRASNYLCFIENVQDTVVADAPPEPGEQAFVRVDKLSDSGIGYSHFEDTTGDSHIDHISIILGPVSVSEGDLVEVEGVDNNSARILSDESRGDDYQPRWELLSNPDNQPFDIGGSHEITITGVKNNKAVGHLEGYPIRFGDTDIAVGQVVVAEIVEYDDGYVNAEIIEKTDEIRRLAGGNFWTNIQWLKKAGYGGDEPLNTFASEFIGVDQRTLPEPDDKVRNALIAEAIRLAVAEKSEVTESKIDNAYVTSIRHWAVHKLSPLLGVASSGETENWFQNILKEGQGSTLVSHGDLIQLTGGYYARSPTRVVPYSESEAVLVSGLPTSALQNIGLMMDIRGVSRLAMMSRSTLEYLGIPIQSQDAYLGLEEYDTFDATFLEDLADTRVSKNWEPQESWGSYIGNVGFNFEFGGHVSEIEFNNRRYSIWNSQADSPGGEYWLRIQPVTKGSAKMVSIPWKYSRIVCLLVDQLSDDARNVEASPLGGGEVRISCNFRLPGPAKQWLHALGAEYENPGHGKLHYRIKDTQHESVIDLFSQFPVTIEDAMD